jgi:hypothetical protein
MDSIKESSRRYLSSSSIPQSNWTKLRNDNQKKTQSLRRNDLSDNRLSEQELSTGHDDNNNNNNNNNKRNELNKKRRDRQKHRRMSLDENIMDSNKSKSKLDTNTSGIESMILRSKSPVNLETSNDMVSVQGISGHWVNKAEVTKWKSKKGIPLSSYPINEDPNPEVILKKSEDQTPVSLKQDITIKYLRPPSLPAPGDIIIKQGRKVRPDRAPPIVIRQYPPVEASQPTLIIRERPPTPPPKIETK